MFFVWCLSVHERWKYNYRIVKYSIVLCVIIELSGYCKCLSTVGEKSRLSSSSSSVASEYNVDDIILNHNNKDNNLSPNINTFLKSVSSINANMYNYTDYFISNKTKNYNKLIYQDINIESLYDNDNQHLENDNNNNNLNNNDDDDFIKVTNLMYFGTENYTVVTSQIGSTANVPCSVHHISEGMVSWIRRKDYHLLTVGLTTYSSDERFSTIHLQHSEDWTLQIKFVQLRDAGVYECQVSTHPPTSIFIQLNVVESHAEITGPSEKFLKPGSTLRLACKVMRSTEPPLYIFWYHNNRMINYDNNVNVNTESDNRYSELTIQHTSQIHSGNYSCVPNTAAAASTFVHIFNGENPAAIHHVGNSNRITALTTTSLVITSMTLVYQCILFYCIIKRLK